MASSGSMDDSFRLRVEKIFGSLACSPSLSSSSSSSSSSQQSVLWSLTGDDVERREWGLDKGSSDDRSETPCSSSFDELLKKRRSSRNLRKRFEDDLEDPDDDEGGDDQLRRRGEDDGDDWEIRSSVGLDRTLDNEEEEDEYDKVASGRENAGERLYMSDITDQRLSHQYGVPNSLYRATRDPRANHVAAKIRLKEDESEAQNFKYSHNCGSPAKESHAEPSEDGGQLRSILKRKEKNADSKPRKRVRFELSCENDGDEASEKFEKDFSMDASLVSIIDSDRVFLRGKNTTKVPDYLLNPSKYTCYSFDLSNEFDEKSKPQACMELLKLVKRSKPSESGSELEVTSDNVPKSVTFIPKKKACDVKAVDNSNEVKQNGEDEGKCSLQQAVFPVGIAARKTQKLEADAKEDDDHETDAVDRSAGLRKPDRHYRTKTRSDDSDS